METRKTNRIASQASLLAFALLGLILLAACDPSTAERARNAGVAAQGEITPLQSATPTVTGTPPTATATVTGTPPTATPTATATATATSGTATATVAVTTTTTPGLKVTICHRTSSANNPYNMITVAESALPAHAGHGDIIPAPAGGCPDTWQTVTPAPTGTVAAATSTAQTTATAVASMTATPVVTATAMGTAGAKVTLCHATSSAKNPYVMITVDQSALPAHQKHGDIIPAPAGGCPQPTAAPAKNTQPKANQAPKQNNQPKQNTQKKVTKPAQPKANPPAAPQNNGQQNKPAEEDKGKPDKPDNPGKGGGKK